MRKKRKKAEFYLGLIMMIFLCSCKEAPEEKVVSFKDAGEITMQPQKTKESIETENKQSELEDFEEEGFLFQGVQEEVYTTTKLNVREHCSTDSKVIKMLPERAKLNRIGINDIWSKVSMEEGDYYVATEHLTTSRPNVQKHLVAINAGHQDTDNKEQEAIGPGAKETKEKVTKGTVGVATDMREYSLTLEIARKVEEKLKEKGYSVFMVRESNDLNMGNRERAKMAAEAGAEILINLHANGSTVSSTNGAMAVCISKENPYIASIYKESRKLADSVIGQYIDFTGANNKGVWETDLMMGLNWSTIPAINLEMGFLSNPKEDKKMADPDYQEKMACGIAEGIEAYFAG